MKILQNLQVLILTGLVLMLDVALSSGTKRQQKDLMNSVTSSETSLIVMAAPSINDYYYNQVVHQIIDFMVNFARILHGKDDVVILVDKRTLPYFTGRVPNHILIEETIDDIWIRDFGLVIPSRGVKFRYAPIYHTTSDATFIDKSFERWLSRNNLHASITSKIILDGGNVVDTSYGRRAIVTDRVLIDNPNLDKTNAKTQLQTLLGVDQLAIIPELPGDTTGHSDGMLMWVSNNKILMTETNEPQRRQIMTELKTSFPGVVIQEIPDYYQYGSWKDFVSACNVYVNSIVTDQYIYMPTFNVSHDASMLKLIQSHTTKSVIPVPAEKVCFMGGSVRCLSWQVKGELKEKILKLTRR